MAELNLLANPSKTVKSPDSRKLPGGITIHYSKKGASASRRKSLRSKPNTPVAAEQKPAETPAETSAETSAETPAEIAKETPAETPAEIAKETDPPASLSRLNLSTSSLFSQKFSRISAPPPIKEEGKLHIKTSAAEELEEKRELLFKFHMLNKKAPQDMSIPEFSIHSDINLMRQSYELIIKQLGTDSVVETYRQYLTYMFMGIEMVFGKFTKINMSGFTQHQQGLMNQYDKLLVELGEKISPHSKSKLPVELRLVIMVMVNSVFFIIARMLFRPELASNFLKNFKSESTPTTSSNVYKMKMPSI